MERLIVLKSEVRLALTKMNRNKSAGPNEIVKKMLLSALDDDSINKITEIIKEIYDSEKNRKN